MQPNSLFRHALRLASACLVSLFLLLGANAAQAVDPVNKSFLGGVAIKGYDPVAYFEQGKPVEGNKQFEQQWKDATWRFASAANRDKFKANPEKYAPQYGGYCAYAVSLGVTADIDPEAWSLVDGKLYLNKDKSIQKTWSQDIPGHIKSANENWPKIVAGK
jgi:YHS domain-containing protein